MGLPISIPPAVAGTRSPCSKWIGRRRRPEGMAGTAPLAMYTSDGPGRMLTARSVPAVGLDFLVTFCQKLYPYLGYDLLMIC